MTSDTASPVTSAAAPATPTSSAPSKAWHPKATIVMNDTTAIRFIGQPLRRREDFKFLAGKGRYTR